MKWLKGIILGVLLAASVLMPFNIKAEEGASLSEPFVGYNVSITEMDTSYNYIRFPTLNFGYVSSSAGTTGYISGSFACTALSGTNCTKWTSQNSSGQGTSTSGMNIYMNLANLKLTASDNLGLNPQYTYVYEYEFILDSNYVGWVEIKDSSNNLTTVYVNGTSFLYKDIKSGNITYETYTISDYELNRNDLVQWDFPIESFNFIEYMFSQGYEVTGFNRYNLYTFPMFKVSQNDMIYYSAFVHSGSGQHFVLWIDKYVISSIVSNYFSLSNSNLTIENFDLISRNQINGVWHCLIAFDVVNNTSSNIFANMTYINSADCLIMPIYTGTIGYKNISTDFALQFGLTNRNLDNIDLLANGNIASNEAASDLESGNDQMADDMDDLATIENGYNQDFNNQLQNIDFTNPITNNQGILPAANFVITVFNGLINNNPFSLLIIICCILLIGKKVIGK